MENKSELAPLKERFEVIAQSVEQYPIDFDEAWQWIGYAKKQNAVDLLLGNFEVGFDFCLLQKTSKTEIGDKNKNLIFTPKSKNQVNHGGTREGAGRPSHDYHLTTDCFKSFCMMAGTERGKEVRKYYLGVEKAFAGVMKTGGGLTAAQTAQLALLPELTQLMGETRQAVEDPKAKAYRELEGFTADNLELHESNKVGAYVGMLYYIYKKEAKHPLSEREFMFKIALDHPEFELKCLKKAWFFDGCCMKTNVFKANSSQHKTVGEK